MNPKKSMAGGAGAPASGVPKAACAGVAVAAALAVSAAGGVGLSFAATGQDYAPTLLGNSAYTNQTDERNAYTVEAMNYLGPISSQNSDAAEEARAAAVQIGTASDDATPITVTNSLGKAVKEFTFRTSAESSYPSNQMSGQLAAGETAGWNFVYDYTEYDYTNEAGVTSAVPINYLMQVTFDDGTTAEFHNVNMNGVRTINLCYSEDYGVYYVERTTITNHTPDPNLYYETNLAAYEGPDEEFDYHVNSAGAMGERMITESRGGDWRYAGHDPLPEIEDFGADIPLHGESDGDYADGLYEDLYWNADDLTWR